MKNTVIKTLTLMLFVGLMGTFVAYRAGAFGETDGSIQLSPNGSALKGKKKDSLKKKRKTIISSSKRAIIVKPRTKLDTPRKLLNPDLSGKKNPRIIPGSKSGKIFTPKNQKKVKVLPSSKSGAIFTPKDKKKVRVLPSSKSGVVFRPKAKKIINPVGRDTTKKKKK